MPTVEAVELARAVPALARQGRCLLPADALASHGLTTHAVLRSPTAPALKGVAADLLGAEDVRPPQPERMPSAWIAAALPAVLARRDRDRLMARGAAVPGGGPWRTTGDRLAVVAAALRRRA